MDTFLIQICWKAPNFVRNENMLNFKVSPFQNSSTISSLNIFFYLRKTNMICRQSISSIKFLDVQNHRWKTLFLFKNHFVFRLMNGSVNLLNHHFLALPVIDIELLLVKNVSLAILIGSLTWCPQKITILFSNMKSWNQWNHPPPKHVILPKQLTEPYSILSREANYHTQCLH